MKQVQRLGMVTILVGLFSLPLYATTQVGLACPLKFIGTVVNVEDVVASAYPKVEVSFQVIQTLKGAEATLKKIQLVKNGPLEFKNGEIYTVEMRDAWLCTAEILTAK
jgi:hypothetical protein